MKNLVKFGGGGILIALIALGVLVGIRYLRYRNDPAYQNDRAAYRYVEQEKQLIQQMKDDPYGGETPEETLRLFIDALKKGDTDLASKYFVIDEQEKWRGELAKIKEKELLGEMIEDLERLKTSKVNREEAFYTATNKEGIVSVLVIIKKGLSGKWKITEL